MYISAGHCPLYFNEIWLCLSNIICFIAWSANALTSGASEMNKGLIDIDKEDILRSIV